MKPIKDKILRMIFQNRIHAGLLSVLATLFFLWIAPQIFSFNTLQEEAAMAHLGEEKKDPFQEITLTARAVAVFDILKGEMLYEKHSEAQLPLASLTKVMTALVAKEMLSEKEPIAISLDAIRQEGDSGFRAGELFLLNDLVNLTLVASINDGAYALAQAIGAEPNDVLGGTAIELMNKRVNEIGLAQTFFVNPSGLDTYTGISGAYGSARDFTFLLRYIIMEHPSLLSATSGEIFEAKSLNGTVHRVKNTDYIVASIPGIFGSKTGFTDLAGGNLAIVFEIAPLHPIAVVVLGSTEKGRFEDVKKLTDATILSFER